MMKKLKMISGVLNFALMGANVGANFYGSWAEHIAYSQRGWEAKEANGKPVIWTVDADGPAAALILPYMAIASLGGGELLVKIPGTHVIEPLLKPLLVGYPVAGLVALIVNYRAADANNKRRTRVVVAGCGVGLLSVLIALSGGMFGLSQVYPGAFDLLGYLLPVTLPLIPLSFAYAIVRHKVIPVSLIISRSARYVLVSRGAILMDMIAAGLSVTALLTYIFSRERPPIATRIQTALQTVNVTIFLRDQTTGGYNSAYSRDYSETDGRAISLSRNCQLTKAVITLERASDNGHPVGIELDWFLNGRDGQDSRDGDGMSTTDREILRELKATLLMPLASKEELLGLISLGPRLGDLPFSREDKQLLMSVGGPTALAIENARLVEQMVAEARRLQEIEVDHRRKTEELAYARQLQLSMLPARNVSLANVEVIGKMRAATEVGGDYYDFIEMADGRICVAVGDATGHGMAAGLVVGMVKMGLINGLQRMNGQASVKQVIEDLNRALKQSLSWRGMGMCLGAAILDASTLKVEVVSNGMPAPYHYRAVSSSLTPIETQAPPLGFLRRVNVRPVEMRLQA